MNDIFHPDFLNLGWIATCTVNSSNDANDVADADLKKPKYYMIFKDNF